MTEEIENGNGESKRTQKVMANYDGASGIVSLTILGGEAGQVDYDVNELPQEVQNNLLVFGLYKKLGSQGACAGKEGVEAEQAAASVFNALKSGDWTMRQPATPKVSMKDMASKLAEMDDTQQDEVRAALAALGVNL